MAIIALDTFDVIATSHKLGVSNQLKSAHEGYIFYRLYGDREDRYAQPFRQGELLTTGEMKKLGAAIGFFTLYHFGASLSDRDQRVIAYRDSIHTILQTMENRLNTYNYQHRQELFNANLKPLTLRNVFTEEFLQFLSALAPPYQQQAQLSASPDQMPSQASALSLAFVLPADTPVNANVRSTQNRLPQINNISLG